MTGAGQDNERWVLPLGSAAAQDFSVSVTNDRDDWTHTSLRVADLQPGRSVRIDLPTTEVVVVPLRGSVRVFSEMGASSQTIELAGRESVFAAPTDVAYVPAGGRLTLTAVGDARVALCGAEVGESGDRKPHHLPASDVPVELRGAGQASREVRNFGTPDVLDADRLIACEVLTPAGNWSSYPPHKHDEERPGVETELEEIYYFELGASGEMREGADPVGYQRVYGTQERPIDVLAEVRTGDVVLVPHGWHGPAAAPPGYDLYYLNVMAGPGAERAWLICDDPSHAWVREGWETETMDPRLPFGGGTR